MGAGVCSLRASGLLATLTTRTREPPAEQCKKLSQSHVTLCHIPNFPKTVLTVYFYCMEAMVVITMMTPRFAYRCTVYTLPHPRKRAQRQDPKKKKAAWPQYNHNLPRPTTTAASLAAPLLLRIRLASPIDISTPRGLYSLSPTLT